MTLFKIISYALGLWLILRLLQLLFPYLLGLLVVGAVYCIYQEHKRRK